LNAEAWPDSRLIFVIKIMSNACDSFIGHIIRSVFGHFLGFANPSYLVDWRPVPVKIRNVSDFSEAVEDQVYILVETSTEAWRYPMETDKLHPEAPARSPETLQ
jgi:hypothetical protein